MMILLLYNAVHRLHCHYYHGWRWGGWSWESNENDFALFCYVGMMTTVCWHCHCWGCCYPVPVPESYLEPRPSSCYKATEFPLLASTLELDNDEIERKKEEREASRNRIGAALAVPVPCQCQCQRQYVYSLWRWLWYEYQDGTLGLNWVEYAFLLRQASGCTRASTSKKLGSWFNFASPSFCMNSTERT